MADSRYRLIPMQKTHSIPVHWKFSQSDYDKLVKGHRSNWCVFLRADMVHVCRVGGEEFYRFVISKTDDGIYIADNLETYMSDRFYKSARQQGWSEEKVEQHKVEFSESAIEETAGLLASYFEITVA